MYTRSFFLHLIDFPNASFCILLYNKIFFMPALQKLVTASTYFILGFKRSEFLTRL